jgi:hypothetical protein
MCGKAGMTWVCGFNCAVCDLIMEFIHVQLVRLSNSNALKFTVS